MQLYGDSDESDEDLKVALEELDDDLEQSALNMSQDDHRAFYKSELNEIKTQEFQKSTYLQEISIDGTRLEYPSDSFRYAFPLRNTRLFSRPKLHDFFAIEAPEQLQKVLSVEDRLRCRRGEPVCVASHSQKVAIGFVSPTSVILWNDSCTLPIPVPQMESFPDIVCIDYSPDGEMLVCGFENGCLSIIDVARGIMVQSFTTIHEKRILSLRFLYRLKEEQLVTASIDISGRCSVTNFEKGFFKYEATPLYKNMAYPAAALKYFAVSEDVRILVVANIQKFWIIRIKINNEAPNEFRIILEQDNPLKIQKKSVLMSSVAFGRGLVKNNNRDIVRKYVAVCCWDDVMFTVTGDNFDDLRISKFTFIESSILEAAFIKDSVFVLITKDKGILLFNTVNIVNYAPNRKLCDTRHIQFPETSKYHFVGLEIKIKGFYMSPSQKKFRQIVQKLLKKTSLHIEDSLPVSYKQNFSGNLIALIPGHIILVSLEKWSKSLKTFYDHGEWMDSMHYILSVYQGSNRFITQYLELSREERYDLMQSSILNLATEYHKAIMPCITLERPEMEYFTEEQVKDINNQKCTLLALLIEFLLLSDSYLILFNQIMPKTKAILNDNDAFFLRCLEPFYQERLVQRIPQDVLNYILETYKTSKRIDLLQKLLWSLDHRRIETGPLIKLTLKIGLFKSLSIICSKGEADEFFTPVNKMWSVILLMITKSEFQIATYYCLRLLALVKTTLERQDVLGHPLDERRVLEILKKVIEWLVNEDNLEKLLSLTPAPTFEILLLLVSGENAKLVNSDKKMFSHDQYNSEHVRKFDLNVSKIAVMVGKTVQKISDEKGSFQEQLRSKSIFEPTRSRNGNEGSGASDLEKSYIPPQQAHDITEELQMHFILFQIRLFYNGFVDIAIKRVIDCLAYVFKTLRSLGFLYLQELLGYLPFIKREELRRYPNQKEVLELLRSEYLLLVIRKVELTAKENEHKAIEELRHLTDLTTLSLCCIHLAEKKKEYKRAMDFFLSSKNKLVKIRVFDWLFRVMEQLEHTDEDNFEEMKQALINKITDLIQINSERTRDLFSRFNSESEKVVINKLENYPDLQLEYVENVLKKERDQGHKVDSDLLILNITLLCKRAYTEKILYEVKTFEYPLDNILPPCRQYGVKRATAYVLERLGQIQEAIFLYCEMLAELVRGHLKDLTYNYDLSTKLGGVGGGEKTTGIGALFNKAGAQNMMQTYELAKEKATKEITDEIELIISTCLLNNKFDSTDEIWYILIDNLIRIRDEIVPEKEAVLFVKDICTLEVCHIIATIAEHSNLDILLRQLQERYANNLDLGQLKITFQEIIHNYLYEQSVFASANQLIQSDIFLRMIQVQNQFSKGLIGKVECCECHQELSNEGKYAGESDDTIIFGCKHAYHRGCAVEQQGLVLCQICSHKDENYAYKVLFQNPKVKLDSLNESLQLKLIENGTLQMNEGDAENLEDLWKGIKGDGVVQIKVSKVVEAKRKRRTNKLGYWDRKRNENLFLIEETNADIEAFTKRQKIEEERRQRQELEAKAKKKKGK